MTNKIFGSLYQVVKLEIYFKPSYRDTRSGIMKITMIVIAA